VIGAPRQRRAAVPPGSSRLPRGVAVAGVVLGAAVLALVHVVLRDTYWDYSEGVYALSAHLTLHGHALYTGFVGAQPPGVFLVGAALLAAHDGLEWLRLGVAAFQLGAGMIAAGIVWRLTGSRAGALLTPAVMLLTPWAVHEHGALTPVLCGLLPVVKVPFLVPAVVVVALSADPRRSGRWAVGSVLVAYGVTAGLAGESFWREVFVAQAHTGARSLGSLAGYWAQAGWNLVGLLVCAGVSVLGRGRLRDARLFRLAAGLAAAMLLVFVSNVKVGTSLNITVPVEAALMPLAVCGAVLAFRGGRSRLPLTICGLAVAFTMAQSVSVMASPAHPVPFLRAGSRSAWGAQMTVSQLRVAVARARACPPGVPYSGPPLIAFVAGRTMPAGQPDQFITTHSRTLAEVARRIAAVARVCP
jgi:hypothetical protein